MRIQNDIAARLKDFTQLCRDAKVQSMYAFGSSVTDRFEEQRNDIDLLVEINEPDPLQRGERLMELWDKLEEFFQRKVDLLTGSSLRNPVLRQNIESTKIKIYEGG